MFIQALEKILEGSYEGAPIFEFNLYLRSITGLFGSLLVLAVGVRSAGSITSERERQTLDILLTTPLAASEVVWAKIAGSLYALRGGCALLGFLWLMGTIVGALHPIAVLILIVELMLYSTFAAILGFRFSLTARTTTRAMAATAGVLLFVGCGYLFCCVPVFISVTHNDPLILSCAGCIPMILGVSGFELNYFDHSSSNSDNLMVLTVFLSLLVYLAVSCSLISMVTHDFDLLIGRGGGRKDRG